MQHSVGRRGNPSRITPRENNLRGLAPVVGTTLLILLGVIAVVAIGVFILNLVDTPQLSPTVSCFDAQASSPLTISAACYNQTTRVVQVTMYRTASSFVYDSVLFTLEGATSSSWTCGQGCGLCMLGEEGISKTYYSLPLDAVPSSVQVLANGCALARASVSLC